MARRPPDILITTPESLYLLLTSQARESPAHGGARDRRRGPRDRGHQARRAPRALAGAARAADDARSPQRIGLSATQRPLETIARFLGGVAPGREVTIVDAGARKPLELQVVVPVEDLARLGEPLPLEEQPGGPAAGPEARVSIWPAIHPRILELIRQHRSTIVFVQQPPAGGAPRAAPQRARGRGARPRAPRLDRPRAARRDRGGAQGRPAAGARRDLLARARHRHGRGRPRRSRSRSPTSVARGLQRIGRAGHQVGAPSRGVIFPKYRGDLLEVRRRHRADARGRDRDDDAAAQPARRARAADRRDGGHGPLDGRRDRGRWSARAAPFEYARPRGARGRAGDAGRRVPVRRVRGAQAADRLGPRDGRSSRAGATRGSSRSPAAARSRTAACSACSSSASPGRSAGASASSTRRWSTRRASAR